MLDSGCIHSSSTLIHTQGPRRWKHSSLCNFDNLGLVVGHGLHVQPGFASSLSVSKTIEIFSCFFLFAVLFLPFSSQDTHTPKKIHRTCISSIHSFEHLSKAWSCSLLAQIPHVFTYECAKEIPLSLEVVLTRIFATSRLMGMTLRGTHFGWAGTTQQNQAEAWNSFHRHNPCGKRLNNAFPNFCPHRRDTVQLRFLPPLCHRLGRVRAGQGVVLSRHNGHRAEAKFPDWEGAYELLLSSLKVFES